VVGRCNGRGIAVRNAIDRFVATSTISLQRFKSAGREASRLACAASFTRAHGSYARRPRFKAPQTCHMMCAGQCVGVVPKANRAAASGRRRNTKKAWLNQSIEPRLSLSRAADANGIPGWYRGAPQWLPVATLRTGQGAAGHVCPQSTALARGTPGFPDCFCPN
jgi:hypothetical protein